MARILLAAGADVNTTAAGGTTALSEAVSNGMPMMVKLLCNAGAGASAGTITSQGWTPRSLATFFVLSSILASSVNSGGTSNKKNQKGTAKATTKGATARAMQEYVKQSVEVNAALQDRCGEPEGQNVELVQAVHFSSLLTHLALAFNGAVSADAKARASTPAELKHNGYLQDLAVLQLLMQAAGLPAGSTAKWASGDVDAARGPVNVGEWMKGCTRCGVVPDHGGVGGTGTMKRCSACGIPQYCSAECQKKDWKSGGHKIHCKWLAHVGAASRCPASFKVQHSQHAEGKSATTVEPPTIGGGGGGGSGGGTVFNVYAHIFQFIQMQIPPTLLTQYSSKPPAGGGGGQRMPDNSLTDFERALLITDHAGLSNVSTSLIFALRGAHACSLSLFLLHLLSRSLIPKFENSCETVGLSN